MLLREGKHCVEANTGTNTHEIVNVRICPNSHGRRYCRIKGYKSQITFLSDRRQLWQPDRTLLVAHTLWQKGLIQRCRDNQRRYIARPIAQA